MNIYLKNSIVGALLEKPEYRYVDARIIFSVVGHVMEMLDENRAEETKKGIDITPE